MSEATLPITKGVIYHPNHVHRDGSVHIKIGFELLIIMYLLVS